MAQSAKESSQKEKKPYESPKLLVYGDLREMTLSRGNRGQPDGGNRVRHQRTGG